MTYAIEGRHCELLRVELADGERVIAEVGMLVYLRGAVEWHVVFPGCGRRPAPGAGAGVGGVGAVLAGSVSGRGRSMACTVP